MHNRLFLAVAVVVAAFSALAQTTVKADQGKPGTQGPWPVTVMNDTLDGGSAAVFTNPCSALTQKSTTVGASAVLVPAAPQAGRIWIQICNDGLNSSGSQCKCSNNVAVPTFAVSSPGDFLATTDCATYPISTLDGGTPVCICNGAGIQLSSTECVP